MPTKAHIKTAGGRGIEAAVRHHVVRTDRPIEDGGTDSGCTSGELLLITIGSCAMGSLRSFLERSGIRTEGLALEVFFEPASVSELRDRIVITITDCQATTLSTLNEHDIREATTAGGVVSRLKLGSEIEVRIL